MQENENIKSAVLLKKLGELSLLLMKEQNQNQVFFEAMDFIRTTMGFDLSVLYRVDNFIEDEVIILEVIQVLDSGNKRPKLKKGAKILLRLEEQNPLFLNEIESFLHKNLSWRPIPDIGCDVVGYIPVPEGWGFLFSADFITVDKEVASYEISAIEVVCNMLSSIIMRLYYRTLATVDSLTGVFNRRSIMQHVAQVWQRNVRDTSESSTIVLTDIDFFKTVNDTWGHLQGDVVLKEFSAQLQKNLRKHFELVGRYGGEEFLIVFEGVGADLVCTIIERIRKKVAAHKFTRVDECGSAIPQESLSVTASFGVATIGPGALTDTVQQWIGQADVALYQAKELGRNQVILFSSELQKEPTVV